MTPATSTTDWLPAAIRSVTIERRLKPGQTLFHAGNRSLGFYEVVGGTVRLIRVDRSGREAVLQTAVAGETLAEASLFSSVYHCDAVALTEAVVRLYPKAAVLSELQRDSETGKAFAAMLARQVMALRTRLERRNIYSARDRIRHYLTVNAGADGRTVALTGTVKQLAAELGLSHEALYRVLARMEAEGEIKKLGATIKIKSMM
jgi:CRP/FNR family transcriptional regulator, dissimilatory nitrate respiration regulator